MTHYSEYKVPDAVLEVAVNAYQKAGEGNVTYTGMRAALEAAYKLLDALNRNKHTEISEANIIGEDFNVQVERTKKQLEKNNALADAMDGGNRTQNTGEKK